MQDFEMELQEWLQKGDQVIVGGDLNESVFSPRIRSLFERYGMRNSIFQRHGERDAPPTYQQGSQVIDGIWATQGLSVVAGGYFAPGEEPTDHSLLWIDVTYESALGHGLAAPATLNARRLRLYDSKTTKKYLDRYEKNLEEKQIIPCQIRLMKTIQYGVPLSPEQANEANAIDYLKEVAMKEAESKCRKL
jgi:hypothetical protein